MTTSARIRFGGVALCIAAIACHDYAHTNPYDWKYPVSFSIIGPDTLFSLGEEATYVVHSPQFPDTAIGVSGAVGYDRVLGVGNTGTAYILVEHPPLYPAVAKGWITVAVGGYLSYRTLEEEYGLQPFVPRIIPIGVVSHLDSFPIVVTQRLTKVQLRCPDVHACDTISVGGTASVWVDGTDALKAPVADLLSPGTNSVFGLPIVTYSIRDTAIASAVPVGIRALTITAKMSGATWVVGTRGALVDSLRVVVR